VENDVAKIDEEEPDDSGDGLRTALSKTAGNTFRSKRGGVECP
jgi:hypothetical protein